MSERLTGARVLTQSRAKKISCGISCLQISKISKTKLNLLLISKSRLLKSIFNHNLRRILVLLTITWFKIKVVIMDLALSAWSIRGSRATCETLRGLRQRIQISGGRQNLHGYVPQLTLRPPLKKQSWIMFTRTWKIKSCGVDRKPA